MQISVKLCLFAAVSWVWCIKLLFTSRMCFTEMHFTWNIHVWGKMNYCSHSSIKESGSLSLINNDLSVTGTLSGSYVMLISGCFCVHDFHHQWPTWQAVNNDLQWWAMITPSCFLTSVKEILYFKSYVERVLSKANRNNITCSWQKLISELQFQRQNMQQGIRGWS